MPQQSERYKRNLRRFIHEVSLYPVSCEKLAQGRSDEEWLDQVLEGGARIVQLRDKHCSDRRLLEKARYFRSRTLDAGALFFLNDRVDIALLAEADGIHLGQNDLPAEAVRQLAPDLLIGVSCNTSKQMRQLAEAEQNGNCAASYYNIGPLFSTQTKDGLSKFLGPEAVSVFSSMSALPFTVMGGIKLHHLPQLLELGARRIAVVTAISKAEDIATATRQWIDAIAEHGG